MHLLSNFRQRFLEQFTRIELEAVKRVTGWGEPSDKSLFGELRKPLQGKNHIHVLPDIRRINMQMIDVDIRLTGVRTDLPACRIAPQRFPFFPFDINVKVGTLGARTVIDRLDINGAGCAEVEAGVGPRAFCADRVVISGSGIKIILEITGTVDGTDDRSDGRFTGIDRNCQKVRTVP